MVGLYDAGLIIGIDERLERGYFSLSKNMRQVLDYIQWQAPALVNRLKEEVGEVRVSSRY